MSRLRPDFDRTATGYFWLDKLTSPYWTWRDRRARDQLARLLGYRDRHEHEAWWWKNHRATCAHCALCEALEFDAPTGEGD